MTDEYFMLQALKEAKKAYADGEVPVGAVITVQDKIIARGHNQVERLKDPTAHAEIIALTSAFNFTGSKYLPDASIYITIEPCLMCAGALYWSKIRKVVYGGSDEKTATANTLHPVLLWNSWALPPGPFIQKPLLLPVPFRKNVRC